MLLKWEKTMLYTLALMLIAVIVTPVGTVFAEETNVTTSDVEEITEDTTEDSSGAAVFEDGTTYNPNDELPSPSIDQAVDWADRKGGEATNFLQVGGQWLAIIIFIVSAIMTLFGAVAGRVSKGLVGIFIAIIMYAGITFAPTLIDFFSQWLAS